MFFGNDSAGFVEFFECVVSICSLVSLTPWPNGLALEICKAARTHCGFKQPGFYLPPDVVLVRAKTLNLMLLHVVVLSSLYFWKILCVLQGFKFTSLSFSTMNSRVCSQKIALYHEETWHRARSYSLVG